MGEEAGPKASEGTFADAAAFGELVFNCTAGEHSIAALEQAGAANLARKVLIDVANVLDFSGGRPPPWVSAQRIRSASRSSVHFPR